MGRSLNSLDKEELRSLANSNDVSYEDGDTKEALKERLQGAGVTEAPDQLSDEEQAEVGAEQSNRDVEGVYAGGTPGGASESQQTTEASQGGPQSDPVGVEADAPGDRPEEGGAEDPLADLDPAVRGGVEPRPAMPRNPAEAYDDEAAQVEGAEPLQEG